MSENNVSRYKEREQAFFLCFEKLFNDDSISDISEVALESRDDDYSQFAIDCARGVQENIEEIDEIIKSHLSKKWRLERINKVSASILRLAVYEMKYVDDIELDMIGTVINEAVELSKKFSVDDEYKFVNGVLGAIEKDL